jgi:hypothetical protein
MYKVVNPLHRLRSRVQARFLFFLCRKKKKNQKELAPLGARAPEDSEATGKNVHNTIKQGARSNNVT